MSYKLKKAMFAEGIKEGMEALHESLIKREDTELDCSLFGDLKPIIAYLHEALVGTQVKCLDLSRNTPLTAEVIAALDLKDTQVETLRIHECYFGGVVRAFNLQGTPVKELDLSANAFTGVSIGGLNLQGSAVERLRLAYNGLEPSAMEYLHLDGTNVQILDLSWNQLTVEAINVQLKKTALICLDLSHNAFQLEEVGKLQLKGSKLKVLNLSQNELGVQGAQALNLVGTEIQFLNLSQTQLGPEGVSVLKLQGSKVVSLKLKGNDLGVEGVKCLPLEHTQIVALDLSRNALGIEGAQALKNKLAGTRVEELDLRDNQFDSEAIKALDLRGTRVATICLGENRRLQFSDILTLAQRHIGSALCSIYCCDGTSDEEEDYVELNHALTALNCQAHLKAGRQSLRFISANYIARYFSNYSSAALEALPLSDLALIGASVILEHRNYLPAFRSWLSSKQEREAAAKKKTIALH